ncbi:endonuclease/exonuclease/phosphatase family protein [Citrobacter braakii]|uniref:endonuclease/exonuclease/phosphatase family protein n=1 Tax=Citrobacter braakii TaxID=57706 RepID=UPI001906D004|nr:endonuclease/exonuclease/phosphatase family protein [Citrobacter braakii]MBJ9241160.1 endonuclease/exonuclease/phosphatase family protein [Citrobacter braakii]
MLKFMTWNMQGGTGKEIYISNLLTHEKANVIFLQEARAKGEQIGTVSTEHSFTGSNTRPGTFFTCFKTTWHGGYQGGTGIVTSAELGVTEVKIVSHPKGSGERGLLYTTLKRGDKLIYLFCVHAWSPTGADFDKIDTSLLDQIITIAEGNYIVVGGDFNKAAGRYSDSGAWALPSSSHFSGGSLDGFWVHNLKIESFGRCSVKDSDHCPTWMYIDI